MKKSPKPCLIVIALFMFGCFCSSAYGQELYFDYHYKISMVNADVPPKITGIDDIVFPDKARKNGVTGTVKVDLVLGEDGKTRDLTVTQDLPDGITQAVLKILQTLYFEPARLKGRPVASKLEFEFVVAAVYNEYDKNVTKARVTSKLQLPPPADYTGEKMKGKVSVGVLLKEDGTLKVTGVSSVMPKEFDRAAIEAAKSIQFTPAVHKKSKKTVTQQITVEFEFK